MAPQESEVQAEDVLPFSTARSLGKAFAGLLRRAWRPIGLVFIFNGFLALWLIVRPVSGAQVTLVDNVAQFVGPLLILPWCFRGLSFRSARRAPGVSPWVPILLALGSIGFATGQIIWTVYEQILHQETPFPSWADAAFLAGYPFLMLGILLLPTTRLTVQSRTRVALDSFMIMTAIMTFSWYFVLGPTLLQGGESVIARIVGTAYPVWDLVIIAALLVPANRVADARLRPVVYLLLAGLGIVVITDSLFDYLTLHGVYITGNLIDVGWPLGYMIVNEGILLLRRRSALPIEEVPSGSPDYEEEGVRPRRLGAALVPYVLVPAVVGLVAYTLHTHGDEQLEPGTFVGAGILVGLVLLRQIVVILENNRLYRDLHEQHQELAAVNTRLAALATTDPLTGLPNHRALMTALDQEVERAHRYRRPCSAVVLDLDHFKALNDSLGHPAGDVVLREVGFVVRQCLRGVDVLGRWGGEEFVIILPETDQETGFLVAERVRAEVAGHAFRVGGGVHLTCSLGLASFPHDADDRDSLIEKADRAQYAAKRLGRNQVRAIDDPAVAAFSVEMTAVGSREDAALLGTVDALASLVDARDSYTGQHAQFVSSLSQELAVALGLDASEAHVVGLAARLHDVGKVAVPDTILKKPGRLTDDEWVLMRRHPAIGADVVGHVPSLRGLVPAVRSHHERWDGRGYPDGLSESQIPLAARIVGVADAYGAMTSARPYREPVSPEKALLEVRRCSGSQFDPQVVAALEHMLASQSELLVKSEAI